MKLDECTGRDSARIVAGASSAVMFSRVTAKMAVPQNRNLTESPPVCRPGILSVLRVLYCVEGNAENAFHQAMTREELLSRIVINPNVCFGKPCVRGHRLWVSLILDLLASGMTTSEILQEYPGLEEADILACIAYGAEMSRERYVDIPTGSHQ